MPIGHESQRNAFYDQLEMQSITLSMVLLEIRVLTSTATWAGAVIYSSKLGNFYELHTEDCKLTFVKVSFTLHCNFRSSRIHLGIAPTCDVVIGRCS